jgi:DNA polymerase III subunit gamma/tau
MSEFVVSARKYRPATFDTVVGQASITGTLKNAIKNHHLAQAFLFCGPRGVGKTTCARILAKTINCENRTEIIEACNQCQSCISFNDGHSLNIYELDAASNNSVDGIRNLTDQVRFAPQIGKYKVYIIDEVHMLSSSAFNAFLKTLEEPPSHAIFILATTEKHKIIPTILSRCQIFDFNRIKIDDIASHLAKIAEKENVIAESDALHIIAQKADGALRDALSMFDQIVSFAGNNLTYKAAIENLNVLDYDYYFSITDFILAGDIPKCLLTFNEILENGFDGHNFINGLSSHFRDLLVCKDTATVELLEVSDNIKEKYLKQSKNCLPQLLIDALNITGKCDVLYKSAKNQRLLVELCLMQLCSLTSGTEKKSPDFLEKSYPIASPKKNRVIAYKEEKTETVFVNEPSPEKTEREKTEPESQPLPVKQPIKRGYKAQSISLSEPVSVNGSAKVVDHIVTITENTQATEFTYNQLLEAWEDYCKMLKNRGKESLYSTLTKRKPELLDSVNIRFQLDNKVQVEELSAERLELLTYLRTRLHNFSVQLQTDVVATDEGNSLYTGYDKFKRMAEKNPLLIKLKQKLELDIEL